MKEALLTGLLVWGASTTLGCDAGSSGQRSGGIQFEDVDDPDWVPDGTPVAAFGQLKVVGTKLLDESGRSIRLKGVSSMWLNWERDGYAESHAALQWMRDNWRISVIRAAMGISPEGAYLSDPERAEQQVRTIVENAIDLGLYVIIDWHDHEALSHKAQAEEFFEKMARDYGEYPNVIYEPFNEPLAVSWSGANGLKAYHEAIIDKIRPHDPDGIVVLGASNWTQDVHIAARDPVAAENIMYALHFYSCSHAALMANGDIAMREGLAVFITEWGATHADGGRDGIVCEEQAETWHRWMRDRRVSWTAWKLDGCTDSSCLFREGTPVDGGWTDEWLQGHGPFVRAKLLEGYE